MIEETGDNLLPLVLVGFMTTLTILILVIACYVILVLNAIQERQSSHNQIYKEQIYERTVNNLKTNNSLLESRLREATRAAYIRDYLYDHGSPLYHFSNDIYDASTYFGNKPSTLVALAMAESGGCVSYIHSTNNCFGWGGGLWTFTSIPESIWYISKAIKTNKSYQAYQETGDLEALAQGYNRSHWQETTSKIVYFTNEINKYEQRKRVN